MKKMRLGLNLTQQEVAEMAGISRSAYTSIELGNKTPSLNVAIRLKQIFKCESDDIFLIENVTKNNKKFKNVI